MAKKSFIILTGVSGTGKDWFYENVIKPTGKFIKVTAATTRDMRATEIDGREYYFRDEDWFNTNPLAVKMWVNEHVWQPGDRKWMYGLPVAELDRLAGKNLVYDIIEPKYTRALIDWCRANGYDYDFKIIYFVQSDRDMSIAAGRAVMKDDVYVRTRNTCDPIDFVRAGLRPDWLMRCSAKEEIFDPECLDYIKSVK